MNNIPISAKGATDLAQRVIKSFPQQDYNLAAEKDNELSALAASIYLEMLMQFDKVKVMKVIKVSVAAAYLLGRQSIGKRKRKQSNNR